MHTRKEGRDHIFSLAGLILGMILTAFSCVFAENEPPPAFENMQFELWLQKTYDHMGISHENEDTRVFVYVNENWEKEGSWHQKALIRLGCAARTEFAEELLPPYTVEILLWVAGQGGAFVPKTKVVGTISKDSCALNDFFPILPPKKETSL